MFENEDQISSFILNYVYEIQSKFIELLKKQNAFLKNFGAIVNNNRIDNISYRFDILSNNILFERIKESNIDTYIYSEESGWNTIGNNPEYYIICDPYCNSSLTTRSFRESAVAICVTDLKGQLISCAIADMQIKRIFYTNNENASLFIENENNEWEKKPLKVSKTKKIDEAFVVCSFLKKNRRELAKNKQFLYKFKYFHTIDGAIMIGRLANGDIDIYMDPFLGQPLYEITGLIIAQKAGAFIVDKKAKIFNLKEIILKIKEDPKQRYKFIAFCNKELYKDFLEKIPLLF